MASPLENLTDPGKSLRKEPPDAKEFSGVKRSALARLPDSANTSDSLESRFGLVYNAAHARAPALAIVGALAHNRFPMSVHPQPRSPTDPDIAVLAGPPNRISAKSHRPGLIGATLLLLLAGCAVGPNFRRPAPPDVAAFTSPAVSATTSVPGIAGGDAQRFIQGTDISAEWWTLFHSAALTELIERSLKNNPDLEAARAALSVARENVLAQRGVYYPSVAATFAASRQRQSGQIAPTLNSNAFLYNLFTPEVTVSYVPDVFGLNRRTVESLKAQEQEARFQMIATYTTLTANVVVTAIQMSSLQRQVEATRRLVDSNTEALDILKYQFSKGYASRLDMAAQESQLAQVAATLPPLVKQLAQLHDLLAALTGRFPAQVPKEKFELSSLKLPGELPVSLPSILVKQRPDVLQAEASLHDASAKIGIAVADRLPSFPLVANAGSSAAFMDQLFTEGTGFWGVGVNATAPLFQGGQLLHQERAAKAAYAQAAAQYRSTVLAAFQNIADTLTALEQDAETLQAANDAADAAKLTLDLAQRQWRAGYAGYLALLSAEQANQQSQINLVQAEASRYADTAALFQALGGGWWNRPELAADSREP
ncbi:MAG: efflux transporter outer membrane subunit [Steroidobacteraceae bacterium]|jgi:NodT family efflux transporter outer membrane factor (OMF) lipoprotein